MAHVSILLFAVLLILKSISISAITVTYNVTRTSCTVGSTCPTGNTIGQVFLLNGIQAPNLNLNNGDTLTLNLHTASTTHPLTICRNSVPPLFCHGATGNNLLNTPIVNVGDTTSVTFNAPGTYYYGCSNHDAMGATITVASGGD